MLISIAGSQGTGKSTVLNELAKTYPTVTRKTSRSILTDWDVTLSQVNNDRELTVKFQDEIIKRKQHDEKFALESSDIYFTERTYMDLFTYALVAIGKDNQYSDWLDDYYIKCAAAQESYKGICYLTAGHFKPVEDGVRGVNQHYSFMIDTMLLDYTLSSRPTSSAKIFQIHTPYIDERVQQVLTYAREINKV